MSVGITFKLPDAVSFAEAANLERKVQVAGGLVENSTEYLDESQELRFTLVEEDGDTMVVHYDGVKPGNFEEAVQIGTVDLLVDERHGVIRADPVGAGCVYPAADA